MRKYRNGNEKGKNELKQGSRGCTEVPGRQHMPLLKEVHETLEVVVGEEENRSGRRGAEVKDMTAKKNKKLKVKTLIKEER